MFVNNNAKNYLLQIWKNIYNTKIKFLSTRFSFSRTNETTIKRFSSVQFDQKQVFNLQYMYFVTRTFQIKFVLLIILVVSFHHQNF